MIVRESTHRHSMLSQHRATMASASRCWCRPWARPGWPIVQMRSARPRCRGCDSAPTTSARWRAPANRGNRILSRRAGANARDEYRQWLSEAGVTAIGLPIFDGKRTGDVNIVMMRDAVRAGDRARYLPLLEALARQISRRRSVATVHWVPDAISQACRRSVAHLDRARWRDAPLPPAVAVPTGKFNHQTGDPPALTTGATSASATRRCWARSSGGGRGLGRAGHGARGGAPPRSRRGASRPGRDHRPDHYRRLLQRADAGLLRIGTQATSVGDHALGRPMRVATADEAQALAEHLMDHG